MNDVDPVESANSERAGGADGVVPSRVVTGAGGVDAPPLRNREAGPILRSMRYLAHLAAVGSISLLVLTGYHFFQSSSVSVASIGPVDDAGSDGMFDTKLAFRSGEDGGGMRGLIPSPRISPCWAGATGSPT
jgi:hypothetical protein